MPEAAPLDLTKALASITPEQRIHLDWQQRWRATARQDQVIPAGDWSECGILAGRGYGKGLCLDTPIPTPLGWTRNGDLRDGDAIFDERGHVCRVVTAHDPYTPEATYLLKFSDGATLVADGDHLWATLSHRARKQMLRRGVSRIQTDWATARQPQLDCWGNVTGHTGAEVSDTAQLAATATHSARGDTNHCIPLAFPLRLPDADLPIDPWLLGYWLGNGCIGGGQLCAGSHAGNFDDAYVLSRLPGATVRQRHDRGHSMISVPGLTRKLRALDVLGNKHVPAAYLRASEAQRLALLRGLCDSDGHASASSVEFCSTTQRLAQAVVELTASLGERPVLAQDRARLGGRDCGPRYRVTWRGRLHNPFDLPRKRDLLHPVAGQGIRTDHRMLVSVTPVASREVRCITVDSPSRLYLAGAAMVPTHNTRIGAEWLTRSVFEDASGFESCVIAPTYQDVKFVCFEGESGILSVLPAGLLVEYNKSDLFIRMRNIAGGVSMIRGFTAEKPERLRGPQNARIWCDEVAAWQYDEETWDMAMMGLRLGKSPKILWTTTPKPKDLIRKLSLPRSNRLIVRGSTYDNKANLPKVFFDNLAQFEGTAIGRQELLGELIDPEESGIVKRSHFRLWPAKKPLPALDYIILSLDTAFTEATYDSKKSDPDSTACVVMASFRDKEGNSHLIVLDCWSEQMGMPDLIRRVKKELNVSYGDDHDTALIKPMFGSGKPVTSGRKPDLCLIEDKGSGISLRQMLEREGILAYAYNPGRADKLSRLHMVSHIFARKRVWLPESDKFPGRVRTWVEPMLAQLCAYTGPGSVKHDDYVDAMTQVMRLCIDKNLVSVLKSKKIEEAVRLPPKVVINPYSQ